MIDDRGAMKKKNEQGFLMPDLTKPPPGFTRGSGIDVPSLQYDANRREEGLARGAVLSLGEAWGEVMEASGNKAEDQGTGRTWDTHPAG